MKLTYHLRISNKSTNKILFKTWFYNVTYREAMYKAQEYLMRLPARLQKITDRVSTPDLQFQFSWVKH